MQPAKAKRALQLLARLCRTPFKFQGEAVERVLEAATAGERLLLEAPTGAGKTLIAYLATAILSEDKRASFRGLVVVPSRPLLHQHVIDAGWLREVSGVPIQCALEQERRGGESATYTVPRPEPQTGPIL
jgi:superfamily II DNA or RNA helicase